MKTMYEELCKLSETNVYTQQTTKNINDFKTLHKMETHFKDFK